MSNWEVDRHGHLVHGGYHNPAPVDVDAREKYAARVAVGNAYAAVGRAFAAMMLEIEQEQDRARSRAWAAFLLDPVGLVRVEPKASPEPARGLPVCWCLGGRCVPMRPSVTGRAADDRL